MGTAGAGLQCKESSASSTGCGEDAPGRDAQLLLSIVFFSHSWDCSCLTNTALLVLAYSVRNHHHHHQQQQRARASGASGRPNAQSHRCVNVQHTTCFFLLSRWWFSERGVWRCKSFSLNNWFHRVEIATKKCCESMLWRIPSSAPMDGPFNTVHIQKNEGVRLDCSIFIGWGYVCYVCYNL